eukprot:GHUV01030971.1.p1 GENE.GHUV01030971.1~~GHUV01030971.1.p1  ORF type:complete len:126 (+),score=7.21 GHUV01030971.1:507-884(+)
MWAASKVQGESGHWTDPLEALRILLSLNGRVHAGHDWTLQVECWQSPTAVCALGGAGGLPGLADCIKTTKQHLCCTVFSNWFEQLKVVSPSVCVMRCMLIAGAGLQARQAGLAPWDNAGASAIDP